jgi:hypothetical protein
MGRDPAGWKGTVTASQLDELRRHFGGRVEKPEEAGVEEDPKVPPEDPPAPISVDVKAIAGSAGELRGEPLTAESENPPVSSATTMRMFGLPPRPPAAT